MKKAFLVTLLYLTAIYAGNNGLIAQNSDTPQRIEISEGLFKSYYVGTVKIKDMNHLDSILNSVNDRGVYDTFSRAKDWNLAAYIFATVGGSIIGHSLGEWIFDDDLPRHELFYGLGIAGIGMIFGTVAEKYGREAITRYNTIVDSYANGMPNNNKLNRGKFIEERDRMIGKRIKIVLKSWIETTGILIKNYEKWIALQLDDGSISNIALEDVREILLPEDKTDKDQVVEEEKVKEKHPEKEKLTGKRMRIMLNSSVVIKGTVISEDAKWIVLKRADGGISNIARSDIWEMITE